MTLTTFSWLLALSAIIIFSLALFALRRRTVTGAIPFAIILFGEFIWCAGYWFEIRAPSLDGKLFWDNVQFLGTDLGVAAALIFAWVYTGHDALARRHGPLLMIVPSLTFLLVWSNPAHEFVRSAPHMVEVATQSFLVYTYGPWFWVFAGYNYLLTLLTLVPLIVFAAQARSYRQPVITFVLGFSAPVVGSLLTLLGLIPITGLERLDISALTFAFTVPVMTWALFHRRMLDIVPIARTLLVEQMRDAVLVIDTRERVVDINLRAAQLFRLPVKAIVSKPIGALVPSLEHVASIDESELTELSIDQQPPVEIEATITALRGQRGKRLGWLVVLRDITAQKRQVRYHHTLAVCSQALLRSGYHAAATKQVLSDVLSLLRKAAEASRIDLCRSIVATDGQLQTIQFAEEHSLEIAPFPLDECLLWPLLPRLRDSMEHGQAVYGPVSELLADSPDLAQALTNGGIRSLLLVPVASAQGWWGILRVSSERPDQRWDAPTIEFLRAACDMIAVSSRQWEATQVLHEREHFIQRVAHATPDMIYVYDLRDHRLIYTNRVMAPSGHKAELIVELREIEASAALHPDEREQRLAYAEQIAAAADQEICSLEYRVAAPDGRSLWLLRRDTIFARDTAQAPTQILGVVQDITERRHRDEALLQAKDEAEAANRSKSAFLSMMSHELRTPLTAVIGYSQLLEQMVKGGDYSTVATDLNYIYNAGQHLLALINDMLDVSRIEAGKLQIEISPADIPEIVDSIAITVGPLVERNKNTLRINCPRVIAPMYSDVTRVRQVLLNLLNNAAKFTENGTITLTVELEQVAGAPWIIFRIADTGIGIDASQVHKLFKPFSQIDESQSRKYGGTGLGLVLSQRLCHMLGGEITVTSRLGEGSVFTARLPMDLSRGAPGAREVLDSPPL